MATKTSKTSSAFVEKGPSVAWVKTSKNGSAVRLSKAVAAADKRMKPHRTQRTSFLREYAGPYYGDKGLDKQQPLNLLFSLCGVLLPTLVMRIVLAEISTKVMELRGFANLMGLELDGVCKECDAAAAFRSATFDCLFGMGILKTGLGPTPTGEFVEVDDYLQDPGQVFVEAIDLDDYIIEQVRKRSAASFEGDRYRVPLSWAMDSGVFRDKSRDIIEKLGKARSIGGGDKAADLGGDREIGEEEFVEHIELIDLWLPKHNAVVTIPGNSDAVVDYLNEVAWEGPERGPYETIAPTPLPSNVMPVPFIASIYDLYLLTNTLANKTAEQAVMQKDVPIFDRASKEDADAVRKADDQEWTGVDSIDRIKVLSFGAANNENYKATDWFHAHFIREAGNLGTLGGLESQAPTLGQEQMLFANASARVNDMQNIVHAACSRVLEKMGWYLWTDPLRANDLTMRLPGGIEIPARWTPEAREGRFLDYSFNVSAYSTGRDSPQEQYRRLLEVVERVIVPLSPLAASEGSRLNVGKLIETIGRQIDIPELDEIFVSGEPILSNRPVAGAGHSETTNISLGGRGQRSTAAPTETKETKNVNAQV